MTSFSADGPNVHRMLARLEKSKVAYRRSDQYAYSRGYLDGMAHVELIVREELSAPQVVASQAASPVTELRMDEMVACGNCGKGTPIETEQVVFSPEEDNLLSEGPICIDCLDRTDRDICATCNAIWWTGVAPPYTELNSPGAVCPACWQHVLAND